MDRVRYCGLLHGERLQGSLFLGYQNESFQADNITDDLIARGVRTADGIGKLTNVEGAFGGPIKKDNQPSVILNPRTVQVGAVVRF